MPLDRRAERLIAMLAATGSQAGETPASRREALTALAGMADEAGAPMQVEHHEIPGPGGEILLRAYTPPEISGSISPGVVFFHGGGWVAGDLETHDGLCRRLAAAAACRVIAVDYRRAPEHAFPAALNDCLAAARWVAEHAASFGVDAARLAVAGDSVGGGLAAAVAQAARDDGGPTFALQLLICPILDAAAATRSREAFAAGYFISQDAFAQDLADYLAGDVPADDPRVSPLRARSLTGLAPAIIHTAEYDPFRDEGELYAKMLRDVGVPSRRTRHAGMIHYFYAMARAIPYAQDAAAMIGAELREAFASGAEVALTPGRSEV